MVYLGTGKAQTVIWQETFDGTGNWGMLNQSAGSEGCNANPFYISCQENGNAVGTCGSGCGSNSTLHVGSIAYGDIGAAYDAGGGPACGGLLACIFGGLCNTTTDRRSTSATISTTGYNNISLEFDYIEMGSGGNDNCVVEYSTNSGSTWQLLQDTPKTINTGCGGQGRWTHLAIPLPAACENISTLQVAFHWRNNNDAAGTDPSFAVNDVMLTTPNVLPVEMTYFSGACNGGKVRLDWATASETNNSGFAIHRSSAAVEDEQIGWVPGAGNAVDTRQYTFLDPFPIVDAIYYLLQRDYDGKETASEMVAVNCEQGGIVLSPNPSAGLLHVQGAGTVFHYRVYSTLGTIAQEGQTTGRTIQLDRIPDGLYLIQVNSHPMQTMVLQRAVAR